jgi:hypothetical protein
MGDISWSGVQVSLPFLSMILENLDLYHFSDIQSIFLLLSQKSCHYPIRKWENADGRGEKWLVVLLQTLIKFVLTQLHNSVTGGHLGIQKTLSKVRERFSWFKQRQDVAHLDQ